MEGFIYSTLDIEDPAAPRKVGRWFLPEQFTAGGATPPNRPSHHGPAYPVGTRAYLPYGQGGLVILDISDVSDPRLVSRLDLGGVIEHDPPAHRHPAPRAGIGAREHRSHRRTDRGAVQLRGIVDISNETAPRLISLLPPPVPDPAAPYPNFNTRGGRFGPHNQHHHQGNPHLFQSDQIVYLTWFNAGLRVYDISDPCLPRGIGWFLPDDPVERRGLLPQTALVTQSEDVLVDARGFAYLTDKNHGLHVVRLTG